MTDSKDGKSVVKYRELFKYTTKREKLLLVFGSLMSACQGAMMPLFSIVYGQITEDFTPNKPPSTIRDVATKTAIYMFLLGIGMFVFCFIGSFIWAYVGAKLAIKVKKLYFDALLGQEMGWFDLVNPERLTIAYVEDMQKFKDATGFKNHVMVYCFGTTIIGFIVGYTRGWLYSLIVTVTFPIILTGMVAYVLINQRESKVTKGAYESAGATSEQALSAIKTVKSLCGEEHELDCYKQALNDAKAISIKYGFLAAFCYGIFMMCMTASYGLNYWLGSILVDKRVWNDNQNHDYNIVDVVTIFFAIVNGGFALGQTSPALKAMAAGKEAAFNIYKVIERKSLIPLNDESAKKPEKFEGEIEFIDVKFTYPSRPEIPVLKGVSLKIPKGKKVALVGETGCGKSTTIQLIERYYDPCSGTVRIDGQDIKDFNLSHLRKSIGYVGQEPILFAMTIKENLLMAKPDATEGELFDALTKANALNFIMKLEKKLDTYVGSGGSQLSGGQKQRISIARSILQNPQILLLDEATSALDRKNEREIQETLDRFASNRTTVTIAHRLSTVINSDIIYVFDKGLVVEYGTHEELLQKDGHYSKLVRIQLAGLAKKDTEEESEDDEEGEQLNGDDLSSHEESPDHVPEERPIELRGKKKSKKKTPSPLHSPSLKKRNSSKIENEQQPLSQHLSKHSSKAEIEQSIAEEQLIAERNSRKMRTYLKGNYTLLILGCFFALIAGCVMPMFALFLADMLTVLSKYEILRTGYGDKFGLTWEGVREETADVAMKFLYTAIFALVSNFIQLSFFNMLGQRISTAIRTDLFKFFTTRDQAFFDKQENSPGELCSVLAKDCLIVNSTVSTSYGAVLTGVGSFICGVTIAFYASWRVALVSLACCPITFIGVYLKSRGMKSESRKMKSGTDETRESKTFQETCTNMRTVLSLNACSTISGNFHKYVDHENELTHTANGVHAGLEGFAQFAMFIVYSIIFYAGAEFTLKYNLGFQDFFRSFMGVVFAAVGASMGQQFTGNIAEAKVAANRIFSFMEYQNKIVNVNQPLTTPIKGEIEFINVHFTYPERTAPCFEGLSFKILPKQKVAFAGPSGTGKSTIFSLLYRFYDPQAGQILIDGVDIKKYDIAHLRASLGMVSQEPILFNNSIRYNIKYNQPAITDAEVREACQIANAIKFIDGDDKANEGITSNDDDDGKGFDRKVGLRGSKLSGGQKQRVAIARTVVRKPIIYMFDEATSALDSESEKIVQDAINKISEMNTSLTIAHRISTIRGSDCIFVIEHGKVAEYGTFDKLMAKKGVFYQINEAH
jgi:ATP-binding cassette subfamily B (MDR/TAP) protein 1